MPKLSQTEEILRLMKQKEHIRNIGIVAHIDHGKTTLTDSLLAYAGLLPPQIAGTAKALDYLEEEQKRGITIKTANMSLIHKVNGENYLVNVVDTPGHVDFTGKVARAMRAVDGAIVVVDSVEEIMAQTEVVVRQALEELVKPVLFVNKVDRLITELRLSAKEIQEKFARIIENYNNLVEAYAEPRFSKKWKVYPKKDSVGFGSALHKWGFTFSLAQEKNAKFTDIMEVYAKNNIQVLPKILPLPKAILDMAVKNCPSPLVAQRYRVPKIWKGKIDSEIGQAMTHCREDGPVAMCITSVQITKKGEVAASGRLFSGTIKSGDQVFLLGADKEQTVKEVSISMGLLQKAVPQITAGTIGVLSELSMARIGETLVDPASKDGMLPFEQIGYLGEAVVTITVEPKNPENLPKLHAALERLALEDSNLRISINEKTGEHLISGVGELHLEIALKFLKEISGNIEIVTSTPTTDYRESITKEGAKVMAKSANKQNIFWMQAEPAETRKKTDQDARILSKDENGNLLLNMAQNVSFSDETKKAIISGFRWACKTGLLCEFPLQNVKAKLLEAQLHEDAAQREPAQIMRAISRGILGSFLTAKPTLLEPIYKIQVSVQANWVGTCINILRRRRGKIIKTENRGLLTMLTAYIPVAETFGLASEMRSATSGRAFWQSTFDHWARVPEKTATQLITQMRAKKGLPPTIPTAEKFVEEITFSPSCKNK